MIYADYNGSAPVNAEVAKYLRDRLVDGPFANPNAIHCLGGQVLKGMEKCRKICADLLGAKPHQIIFNSGASEGISTIFHSVLGNAPKGGKDMVIISGIEHASVVNCGQLYRQRGYDVQVLPADSNGIINLSLLENWMDNLSSRLALVSIMAANNETGVIQPFAEIAQLCQKYQIPFFSDTTQYIGKTPFHFQQSQMDFAVCSGHKIGALTGTGIVLAKNPAQLQPLVHGGGQERGYRGGTQNYIGNETLALALTQFSEKLELLEEVRKNRLEFEQKIKERFPQVVIFGDNVSRLAGTTLISFPGLHGQAVQIELESHDIYVTTSSACSDNEPATSKVLKAMNIDDKIGRGVVRISLGTEKSTQAYERILEALTRTYEKLGKIASF